MVTFENIEIVDAASDGTAVAKVNDMVVFIPYGAPGDIVDIQIVKKKKSFKVGKIVDIKIPSSCRVEPFCSHYGLCGGCKWQHLDYQAQLKYKQKQVVDALMRIGKITVDDISQIIPSDKTTFYRNKLEFTFSNFKWMTEGEYKKDEDRNLNGVGFHLSGMFDRIVDIDKCPPAEKPIMPTLLGSI